LNLILFQIPKVRIRGDLIEFTGDSMDEEPTAVRVRGTDDEPNAVRERAVPHPDPSRVRE
jgi:hypothetical protein